MPLGDDVSGASASATTVELTPVEGYTLAQMWRLVREVLLPRRSSSVQASFAGQGRTLTQMRASVRQVLRDSQSRFITDAEIDALLNEGITELAERTHAARKLVTGSATGDPLLPLPTDFLAEPVLTLGGVAAKFISDNEEWFDWLDTSEKPPRVVFRISEASLEANPAPAVGVAYELHYAARPATLSGDTAQSPLPTALDSRAINYARAHCLYMELVFDAGDRYMAMFAADLAPEESAKPPESADDAKRPREIQDSEITDELNMAMLDLAWRTRCIRTTVYGTVEADGSVPLPDDCLRVTSLRLSAANSDQTLDVEFTDDEDFFWFSDTDGTPVRTLGRVWAGRIELWPVPDPTVTYTLRFEGKPLPLVNGSSRTNVPQTLQDKAIARARAYGKYVEGDRGQGDRWMSVYEAGLPARPAQQGRIVPGPITLSVAPGPFDGRP